MRQMFFPAINVSRLIFFKPPSKKAITFLCLLVTCLYSTTVLSDEQDKGIRNMRIVSLGGEITEMIFLLGMEKNVVAVDTTSTWPQRVTELPQVGYLRALSSEGLLSMSPTIVIANEEAGPHAVVGQIKSTGVEFHTINKARNFQGVADNIRQLGKILSREKQAEAFAAGIEADAVTFSADINGKTANNTNKPAILFLLSAGAGTPVVSGKNTSADAMIKLAGGRNVMTSYEGYKPVAADSILAKQPDVILMTSRTLKILGGAEKVLKLPGISHTPAGKNNRVVSLDGMYMLGFGPRAVSAANELAVLLK